MSTEFVGDMTKIPREAKRRWTRSVSVALDDNMLSFIDRLATKNDCRRSDVLRYAIRNFLWADQHVTPV